MRVTVDLDTDNALDMLKAYYNLRCGTDDVEVYRTRRGYHVIGYGFDLTPEEAVTVRTVLGDDENRIRLDEIAASGGNAKPQQILWTHKYGRASRQKIQVPSAIY